MFSDSDSDFILFALLQDVTYITIYCKSRKEKENNMCKLHKSWRVKCSQWQKKLKLVTGADILHKTTSNLQFSNWNGHTNRLYTHLSTSKSHHNLGSGYKTSTNYLWCFMYKEKAGSLYVLEEGGTITFEIFRLWNYSWSICIVQGQLFIQWKNHIQ